MTREKESTFICQLKTMPKLLLTVYVPAFLFIGLVWLETKLTTMTAYLLTADPAEIAQKPPYVGIVSNLGIVLWAASLMSCLIAAEVIKKDSTKPRRWRSFFLFSAVITGLLMFDDMLQIHEQSHAYLPFFSHNGAEITVFSIYGILLVSYIIKCRSVFRKTEYLILLLALGFFAISLVVDVNPEITTRAESNRSVLLEEGAKFLGITSWLTYFARTCLSKLKYNNESEMTRAKIDSTLQNLG